jgi:hypothetical protein
MCKKAQKQSSRTLIDISEADMHAQRKKHNSAYFCKVKTKALSGN